MPIQLCSIKGCINEGRYCRIHRSDTVKPPVKIAVMGDGRKELEKEYRKVRKEFLRLHPICKEEGCKQPAVDIHHSAGKVGEKLIEAEHFVQLCRKHHQYYEVRPVEAKEKGISKSRLSKSKKSFNAADRS